jgi:hypothetical protein
VNFPTATRRVSLPRSGRVAPAAPDLELLTEECGQRRQANDHDERARGALGVIEKPFELDAMAGLVLGAAPAA